MIDLQVNLTPRDAAGAVVAYVRDAGLSTECVDQYYAMPGDGREVVTLVFEKYYMRNSSRASLTVTIENLTGVTRAHAVGSGGGQNTFFSFDWGAAGNFEGLVAQALARYRI